MTDYKRIFRCLRKAISLYLDNAATEQRPACVLDAEREFYERWNANPLRGLSMSWAWRRQSSNMSMRESASHGLYMRRVREKSFLPEIRPRGINLVAYSYALPQLKPGDEILVTIMEHHSNLLPWQMAARRPEPRLNIWSVNRTAVLRRRKSVMPSHPHHKACRADTCLECAWTGDPGRKTDRDGTRKRRCGTGGCGTGSAAYADRCHGT